MKPPRAVLFDAYGTLFDVYGVSQLAEQLFPTQGAALAQLWRDKQIEYTRLLTTSNAGAHYRPFWQVTQAALDYALQVVAARLQLPPGQCQTQARALLDLYRRLPAFSEAKPVLQALKARAVVTGILSNGDPQMLQDVVAYAGLGPWLDHLVSVDAVRRFKTDPAAYALGPQATGLAAQEILLVSCNAWDALGATWYGYQTLWVNRTQAPFEQLGTQPSYVGSDLNAVLPLFSSSS